MLVNITANASGAAAAAARGDVVVIVDVISMSTSLESALDAGAAAVFGAGSDFSRAPVKLDPERMGFLAGETAKKYNTKVILLSEPRMGTEKERRLNAAKALIGLENAGKSPEIIIPNIGSEIAYSADFNNKVVLAVTDCGGVAYDAAMAAGAISVLTGTIARTLKQKAFQPAQTAAKRAIAEAEKKQAAISIVAASSNSLEDVLGAQYIAQEIYRQGFTALK